MQEQLQILEGHTGLHAAHEPHLTLGRKNKPQPSVCMCWGDLFLPLHNPGGKSRARHNKIQNAWIPGALLNSVGTVGVGKS